MHQDQLFWVKCYEISKHTCRVIRNGEMCAYSTLKDVVVDQKLIERPVVGILVPNGGIFPSAESRLLLYS